MRFRVKTVSLLAVLLSGATTGCGVATKTVTATATDVAAASAPATTTSSSDTTPAASTPTDISTPSTDTTTAPSTDTTTTDTTGPDTSTGDTSGTGQIPTVPVGTNQTLSADQEGDQIDTTVTAVQDLSPDQFDTPDPGKHYVGVFLKLHNLGSATFDDSPNNDVTLITNADNTLSNDVANVGDCTNSGDLKVGAGETLRTCVTFQEPNDQTVKVVEVSLDSGNDAPGEWTYH